MGKYRWGAEPLIHAYFDINLDILWQTVVRDLPELSKKLTKAIADHKGKRLTCDKTRTLES